MLNSTTMYSKIVDLSIVNLEEKMRFTITCLMGLLTFEKLQRFNYDICDL